MFDFEGVRSLHIWADYSMINITVAKPVGERCPILIRYIERREREREREREGEILSKQRFALFCLSLSAFLLICFSHYFLVSFQEILGQVLSSDFHDNEKYETGILKVG